MIVILFGTMCSVLMLKLRGFKASFNLLSGKKHGGEKYRKSSDIPILGAYRTNKEEYEVNNVSNSTPRKLTPTTANSNHTRSRIKPSKSTSDLLNVEDIPQNTRKSSGDIPSSSCERKHSRGIKNENRDQQKSESQKLPEQKKREKPPRKQENLKKLTEENHEKPTIEKPRKEKKGRAPKPPINLPTQPPQYSSNTLESSISRSSGPPPYSAEVVPNQNDNTGNTSFSKPMEESSWDLVSQHREQLSRPLATSTTKPKSRVLDLHYNGSKTHTSVENSEV